jgi:predicted porin
VIEVSHEGKQSVVLEGIANSNTNTTYSAKFKAININHQYRPERLTPKPRIYGTLPGIIDSEKIDDRYAYLNEYGEYKVQLRFGQNSGAGKSFGGKVENNYGATSFAEGGVLYNQIGGTKTRGGDRAKNSFVYLSPSLLPTELGGLTINGLYSSFNNDNAATGITASDVTLHSSQTDLWLDYAFGPLLLNVSLMSLQDPQINGAKPGAPCTVSNSNFCLKPAAATTAAATTVGVNYKDQVNMQKFAAAYRLPSNTRLHALIDNSSYEVSTALLGSVKRERSTWEIGALQDFGAHHVWLQWGVNSNYKDNGVEAPNTSANYLNLGYSYDLSKEAIVRVYYAKVSNDSMVAYDFTTNPVSGSLNNGASPSGVGIGVRYRF